MLVPRIILESSEESADTPISCGVSVFYGENFASSGVVQYCGLTKFATGVWCGLVLRTPGMLRNSRRVSDVIVAG